MEFIDPRPIGVFDSGIGGLSVLKELLQFFPFENFIYLGDTARLPYGTKSAQTIRSYSLQNMQFLTKYNVKAIVIACNSASSQVSEMQIDGVPIYTVIRPGAELAIEVSINKKIGILGTRATIFSKAYEQQILTLESQADTYSQACPLFVPLAEEGLDNDPITNLIAYRYIQPLVEKGIDTLILGCTHYPLLGRSIAKVTGSQIHLVSSGISVAKKMRNDLSEQKWLPARELEKSPTDIQGLQAPQIQILTTDQGSFFADLAKSILAPFPIHSFELVSVY